MSSSPDSWHRLTLPSLLVFSSPILLWSWSLLTPLLILLFVFIWVRDSTGSLDVDVALRSSMLGAAASLATLLYLQETNLDLSKLYLYLLVLSLFHFSEFVATCVSNPSNVSVDSFLLNHSTAYHLALITSLVEFAIEFYFLPSLKQYNLCVILGLLICAMGEVLRKTAMLTAGTNFNHLVMFEKQPEHELVSHGVFAWMRHPSYLGWFLWSLGTQVLLSNPLCLVLYAVVSWRFFCERIYVEEYMLVDFFGDDYKAYQKSVPRTGIPFVKGYFGKEL